MVKIISKNFFTEKLIDKLLISERSTITIGSDFSTETCDKSWLQTNKAWVDAIEIARIYLDLIEDTFDCDRSKLDDIWIKRNIDKWDIDDHESTHRENADIHKDFFQDYSKVINLQVYASKDIPPEAGTCFWQYTGDNVSRDTVNGEGRIAKWPYINWKLLKQIPFEYNLAFIYNAGPDGVWHSAPITEMLLDAEVPSHSREVIICRFRYK